MLNDVNEESGRLSFHAEKQIKSRRSAENGSLACALLRQLENKKTATSLKVKCIYHAVQVEVDVETCNFTSKSDSIYVDHVPVCSFPTYIPYFWNRKKTKHLGINK